MRSVTVSILKALADENRLRIVALLSSGSLCVCEIEAILEMLQSNVSRHLNKLSEAGIVTYEKRHKYIYYGLNETFINENAHYIGSLIEQAKQEQIIKADMETLKAYRENPKTLGVKAVTLCWEA